MAVSTARVSLTVTLLALVCAACGNSTSGGSGSDGIHGSGGADGGTTSTGDDAFGGTFRHGMNDGHVNASFTDNQGGALGAATGADSNRMKLPEYFLEQWGAGGASMRR